MAVRKVKKAKNDDAVLVTQKGYDTLVAELEQRKQLRDVIAREIDEARDLGDLSENASYKEAMERKDLNESRIEELELLISRMAIVEGSDNDNVISIGKSVEIQNLNTNTKKTIHIVGSTEANPMQNKISIDSPIGKSLVNARTGETVEVKLPSETVKYKIIKIAA